MSVSLIEVTKENWIQCIRLKLAPEQEGLVASNVDSIAESKFELHYVPRAIYNNENVVGFLMYCPEILVFRLKTSDRHAGVCAPRNRQKIVILY